MSLLTVADVQTNFPQYERYFVDKDGTYDEDIIQTDIDNAEVEITQFLTLPASLTPVLKMHLIRIVKYLGFNRIHGDEVFESKPAIVKDYERTIDMLTIIRNGGGITGPEVEEDTEVDRHIRINATTPRSAGWFDGHPDEATINPYQ